VKHGSMKKVTQ